MSNEIMCYDFWNTLNILDSMAFFCVGGYGLIFIAMILSDEFVNDLTFKLFLVCVFYLVFRLPFIIKYFKNKF